MNIYVLHLIIIFALALFLIKLKGFLNIIFFNLVSLPPYFLDCGYFYFLQQVFTLTIFLGTTFFSYYSQHEMLILMTFTTIVVFNWPYNVSEYSATLLFIHSLNVIQQCAISFVIPFASFCV